MDTLCIESRIKTLSRLVAGGVGAGSVPGSADLVHGHVAVSQQQGEVPAVLPHGAERRESGASDAGDSSVSEKMEAM